MEGRVLSIAGSDSGGGAGIQADIKTITALGGFATTALTMLTAQNTQGVSDVFDVDPFFVESQVNSVLTDIGADAIKVGVLSGRTTAELVVRCLEKHARSIPIVVDPVVRASSGQELAKQDTLTVIRDRLLPISALITPNLEEAEALTAVPIRDESDMHRAADVLLLRGAGAVLITGGHLPGENVVDLLRTADGLETRFEFPRIETRSSHGTGCTLSAAIATGLAQGMTLQSAVERSIEYVHNAMRWAQPLGAGPRGPLDHGFPLRERPLEEPVH